MECLIQIEVCTETRNMEIIQLFSTVPWITSLYSANHNDRKLSDSLISPANYSLTEYFCVLVSTVYMGGPQFESEPGDEKS